MLSCLTCQPLLAADPSRHVVIVVWDGMRPDFVTKENAPNLCALAEAGVTFSHHHSVYLSATEVNGTAISTGAWPAHSGIMANHEYRPAIELLKPIHTEAVADVRKGDELTHGHYLHVPTLPEIIRKSGRKAVVAGAKPVALLPDRAERESAAQGATVFAGAAVPKRLEAELQRKEGAFPPENASNPTRNDWTTAALIDFLWADGVPDLSLLWMNQPDAAQHSTSPGSDRAIAGIKNADANLGRVLNALKAKGVREGTDIMVVSDHGFSTVSTKADLAGVLTNAGIKAVREFKAAPKRGEVLIVSNSGSTLVYVIGHERRIIEQVVRFLQQWEHTGVIFTRDTLPGTFGLSAAHLNTEEAPDIVVSLRWKADRNTNGAPGLVVTDNSAPAGQGSHVSLSPFDMHNTLVAAGPDFRSGVVSDIPSGNVDLAPTVLRLLGLRAAKTMDGRVLVEALKGEAPTPKADTRRLEASQPISGMIWHQYLQRTKVNGVIYCDEGNGTLTAGK